MNNINAVKLAVIGECMIELQESGPDIVRQSFGGDTLNTAVYCARLAESLPLQVDYVTALGRDSFSRKMIRFWEREGVGSSLVQTVEGERPGLYYIELDASGERIFHYWRSDSAARKCFEYTDSQRILHQLSHYQAVYLSGITLAVLLETGRVALMTRLQELARDGVAIYFDCNYRANLWDSREQANTLYEQLYRISRAVFLTTEEAELLFDGAGTSEAHGRLSSYGVCESIIKDGANPCSISVDDRIFEVPAQAVGHVVDTTAAGDSFSAAYLVARCFDRSPVEAAKLAHAIAAYVVQHKGALAPRNEMPVSSRDIVPIGDTPDRFGQ